MIGLGETMQDGQKQVLLGLVLGLGLACACAPRKPDAQKFRIGEQGLSESTAADKEADELLRSLTVASVGPVELSGLEVKQALNQLPIPERYYYNNPEKVALFTQNYALVLVYAWLGLKAGKDSDAMVRFMWEDALAAAYREAYLAKRVDPAGFSTQEVDAWLASNVEVTKEALGTQENGPEQRTAFARRQLAEQKKRELWNAYLDQLASELGFPMPPMKNESPVGSGVPIATSSPN